MTETIIIQEVPVSTVISVAEQGPQGIPGVALLSFTGDLTGTGLTDSPLNISLSTTGISAGTYGSSSQSLALTTDVKGRITGISSINISIDASAVTSGILNSTLMPSLTGDLTSVAGSTVTTLKNSGITAGTYTKVTFDSKGIATNGTNPTTLAGFGILDTYTKAEVDLAVQGGSVYFSNIRDKPTTISGYGITNAYTKTEVDALILTVTPDFNTLANKPITLAGYGIIDALGLSEIGTTVPSLVSGKIPASQLPSYVDDVLEFGSITNFPTTGETGKIYIALDTNFTYRWSGSTYVNLSSSGSGTDTSILHIAQSNLAANKLLVMTSGSALAYADRTEIANINRLVGISANSALTGQEIRIKTTGTILYGFVGLTPGAILYLGQQGNFTTTIPTSGILQVIGVVKTTDSIFINIQEPTLLGN